MEYVAEAVDFLRDNLKNNQEEVFGSFSGGKDSIVIAKLLELAKINHKLYHSFTGIDPPEVIQFIRKEYPDCTFLKPSKTFWHHLTTDNPPANFSRWCCKALKKRPGWKIKIKDRVLGIRAEESGKRKNYERINHFEKLSHTHYYPIFDWKEWMVWEFIEAYDLEYPGLYDEGFDRLGCIVCPYHSTAGGKGHDIYRERWPLYFKMFEKRCHEWYNKRVGQGRVMYFDSAEEFISEWYKGNVQWYKRKEKGS